MDRSARRARPMLEGLEGRNLLSGRAIGPDGKPINDKDLAHYVLQKQNNVPLADRRMSYTTPQGTQVILTLYGFGSLKGTTVDPDGALNIVYSGTQATSKIIAHTFGGTGFAPLRSIRDAATPPRDAAATGSEPLNVVNLRRFDLVPGGYINLMGGVNNLFLNSAARDTQIHLAFVSTSTSSTSSTSATGSDQAIGGTGGAPVVGGNTGGAVAITGTVSTTPTATGVAVSIPFVDAGPLSSPPLQPAQIYGYDPTANALIRFNATTGDVTQTIPVGGTGTPISGVGLGRNAGHLVVLVGLGDTIHAYNVVNGAPEGQFTTANLAAIGLNSIDGIGSSDVRTVLTDAKDGPNGLAVFVNVTASLATGQAVTAGAPFAPQREFELGGGATGLAGSDTLYSIGAAHFDTFTPDLTQLGVIGFTTSFTTGITRETSRTAVPGVASPFINTGPPGTIQDTPFQALGSIDGDLALVTGVANGRNLVTLYNPSTLVADGAVGLANPNRLTGLSESFHPELLDAALLDVKGNLKTFAGTFARGLVINDNGTLNLVAIRKAVDTAVIGRPLSHVAIPVRQNVELLSTPRITPSSTQVALGTAPPGTRGGVIINAKLRPAGPLSLP